MGRLLTLTAPTLQRIEAKESDFEEKKALIDGRRKEVEERVCGGALCEQCLHDWQRAASV